MRAAPINILFVYTYILSRLYAPFEDYTMAEVANQAGHASEQTTAVYTNMTWEIIIPWI